MRLVLPHRLAGGRLHELRTRYTTALRRGVGISMSTCTFVGVNSSEGSYYI